MDWEDLFQAHIRERGFDYFLSGHVKTIKKIDYGYAADVAGSENYEVEITIEDGEAVGMDCTCPHAGSGNNCKHMAAVLYALEDEQEKELLEEAEKSDDIEQMVAKADNEKVREFLVQVLTKDRKLLNKFQGFIEKKLTAADKGRYKYQVACIFADYDDGTGYIHYRAAAKFIDKLTDFICEEISVLVENQEYETAFELTVYIYDSMQEVEIDDSDGEVWYITERCEEIWRSIVEKSDDFSLKKQIFNWLISQGEFGMLEDVRSKLGQAAIGLFDNKEFAEQKIYYIEQEREKILSRKDDYMKEIRMDNWVKNYLHVLREVGERDNKIQKLRDEFWHISAVREDYIQECIEKKEYDEAIRVLKESKELDKDWAGIKDRHSRKLKELYQHLEKKELYIRELEEMLIEQKCGDIEIFQEYKRCFSAKEWEIKRENVFQAVSGTNYVTEFYLEEELYERILEKAIKGYGLFCLFRYEDVLKPLFPEKILEKYETELQSMAVRTASRERYKELVVYLRKMKTYPGGGKVVERIVKGWREKYKRRPAMMEELARL